MTKDSAAQRGVKTALQAIVGFAVGLGLAIWQVPGVPDAIVVYFRNNFVELMLTLGVPTAIASGATSFLYNVVFRRKDVPTV